MVATASNAQPVVGWYEPHDIQRIAHLCPADELLYGGAAGGGKSAFLVNDAIMNCLMAWPHPPSCIIFRRTTPELQELIRYSQMILDGSGYAEFNQNLALWRFENGAILRFSHLQLEEDVLKHKSFEYDWIGFDEAGDFLPSQIEYLRTRNRTKQGNWARMRLGTNPGGIGHIFLKDSFVEPKASGGLLRDAHLLARWDWSALNPKDGKPGAFVPYPPGTRGIPSWSLDDNGRLLATDVWREPESPEMVKENERRARLGMEPVQGRSKAFIPAKLDDNPHLDRDGAYRGNLMALRDEAEKARLLYGSWAVFDGQFFYEFHPDIHVVSSMSPPPHWPRWRSLDWGVSKPLACLWHTRDPETKQFITYRELYRAGLNNNEATTLINEMTLREDIRFTPADPSMFKDEANEDGKSLAQKYADAGIPLMRATNSRVAGWTAVRDHMAINPVTGKPGWVVTKDCPNLIRTIQSLVRDKHNPEDLDTDQEDHAVDSLRYFLNSIAPSSYNRRKPVKLGRWM